MANYRLYIDESGTYNYTSSEETLKKFLGLTGIILEQGSVETILQPKIRQIKRMFSNDPDLLPCLHREDIINKSGPYAKLNDPEVEKIFNDYLFSLIRDLPFLICTVVIDKKSHFDRYQKSAMHPYHYCLTVMLERYTNFLRSRGRGDVMAESRGGHEDLTLKDVYQRFYTYGTSFRSSDFIQSVLTSKELKLKTKDHYVAGLELADLLALPTKLDVLHTFGVMPKLSQNFTLELIALLQGKYLRGGAANQIKGYGKKMLS